MNIAICDDEKTFLNQLRSKINNLKIRDCQISEFTSGHELLRNFVKGMYEIIINVKRIMMRNIIYIITAIITFLLFVSCGISKNSSKNGETPDPHTGSIESYYYELDKTEELLSSLIVYFDDKDKESIKSLFASQTRQDYDIDSQIDKVFEIYDGKSVSYDIDAGSEQGKKIDDGKYVYVRYDGAIKNIITNNKKSFEIWISRCVVNDDNEDMIGLNRITLCDGNGKRLAPIGEFGEEEYFG